MRMQGQHPMQLLRSAHQAVVTQGNLHFDAGATPHARLRSEYYFDWFVHFALAQKSNTTSQEHNNPTSDVRNAYQGQSSNIYVDHDFLSHLLGQHQVKFLGARAHAATTVNHKSRIRNLVCCWFAPLMWMSTIRSGDAMRLCRNLSFARMWLPVSYTHLTLPTN